MLPVSLLILAYQTICLGCFFEILAVCISLDILLKYEWDKGVDDLVLLWANLPTEIDDLLPKGGLAWSAPGYAHSSIILHVRFQEEFVEPKVELHP